MTKQTHIGLDYDMPYGGAWRDEYNRTMRRISALLHGYAISNQLSDPPSGAADGDIYIIATGGTNDWTGYDNYIAHYNGYSSEWEFIAPEFGQRLYCQDIGSGNSGVLTYEDSTGWAQDTNEQQVSTNTTNIATNTSDIADRQLITDTYGGIVNAAVQTTDATNTNIWTFTVPTDTTVGFHLMITAHEPATGDSAWYDYRWGFKNDGGSLSSIGSGAQNLGEDAGATAWLTFCTTSGTDIQVYVKGEAAHTINWKAFGYYAAN